MDKNSILIEELVNFQVANKLRELGFNIPTNYNYNKYGILSYSCVKLNWNYKESKKISAPTLDLVRKYLRKFYNLDILVDIDLNLEYFVCIKNKTLKKGLLFESKGTFKEYDDAVSFGIEQALHIIQTTKK